MKVCYTAAAARVKAIGPLMDKWDFRTERNLRQRLQYRLFNALYFEGAVCYDALTRVLFDREWDRWRKTALPLLGDGPVLDLGCGTGTLLPMIANADRPAIGVDRSRSMLKWARRRSTTSQLIAADAAALPFRAATFGSVVSTFPAPFIRDPATMEEITRILRPGGNLIVVVSGTITHWPPSRLAVQLLLRCFYGPMPSGHADAPLIDYPDLNGRWQRVATANGEALLWVAVKREHQAPGAAPLRDDSTSA